MGARKLKFKNEDDYKIARDVNLDMLEREGWKPQPDLEMVVVDSRVDALKRELEARGVRYTEEPL